MKSIVTEQVFKSYGKNGSQPALQNINLSVEKGEILGLIGPDGAGKTTLFRILTTLLLADKGRAMIEGFDVVTAYKKIRNIIGYMPGQFSLYQDLSVVENLEFFASIYKTSVKANYDLIKDIYIQLEPFKNRRAGALSGGMKQKLALSCALIHKPEVLFLDEPTTGVDAVSRKEFWSMLKNLQNEGITIFVSTPYMDEASLCNQIALIQDGQILSVSTPTGLLDTYDGELWSVRTDEMYRALTELGNHPLIDRFYSFGESHHIRFVENMNEAAIRSYLESKGHRNIRVKKIPPTIEDCFMELLVQPKEKKSA